MSCHENEVIREHVQENKEIAECWCCGKDFDFDENKSCFAGFDRYGTAKTICNPCAYRESYI